MARYVIIGAGGQASEVISMRFPRHITGHVVDSKYGNPGDMVGDLPILGDLAWLREQDGARAVCAIGYPESRYDLVRRAGDIEWFTIKLVNSVVSGLAYVGYGCIVATGAIVMNNALVKNHVLLNIASSVSHGSVLGDFCTLAPGARVAGNCTLGEGVFVGMNACITERVKIGRWAKVGAGAVVLEDVPPNCTVVGAPARIVRQREDGWHEVS